MQNPLHPLRLLLGSEKWPGGTHPLQHPTPYRTDLSLPSALIGPTVSSVSFQASFFLLLPANQPATAYLHPKLMQALFPTRNTEAASFWEKSKGNVSLLALKTGLARVPRGCLVVCSQESWNEAANPSPASTALPQNAHQQVGQETLPQQPAPAPRLAGCSGCGS